MGVVLIYRKEEVTTKIIEKVFKEYRRTHVNSLGVFDDHSQRQIHSKTTVPYAGQPDAVVTYHYHTENPYSGTALDLDFEYGTSRSSM